MENKDAQIYKSFAPLGFLATIYKPTYDYLVSQGSTCEDVVIDIVGIDPKKEKPTSSKLLALRDLYEDPNKAHDFLKLTLEHYFSEKRNSYFSLSVHSKKAVEEKQKLNRYARTGGDTSLGFSNIIAIDFDLKRFHSEKNILMSEDELKQYLLNLKERLKQKFVKLGVEPSFIINSGAGLHFYFFLKDVVNFFDRTVAQKVDDFKEKIAEILENDEDVEFDRGAVSAFRIFKLPFTRVFGYSVQGRDVSLFSEILEPDFDKFLKFDFPRYSLDDLVNFEGKSLELIEDQNNANDLFSSHELWDDYPLLREWPLFDLAKLRAKEYEKYNFSLEDVFRGEKVVLSLKRISENEPQAKRFLEGLKEVWAKIIQEFKFKFGISRHFLTTAIHAKLLHFFDIDENFFMRWYKEELFPYLVEKGLEDRRDLNDRLLGAIKRNFVRKRNGEPLGVISFLKSYDNSVMSFLQYRAINEVLTNFLRQWADYKTEKLEMEDGKYYVFYRLIYANDNQLELAKFEVAPASTKLNYLNVFEDAIEGVYSVTVSKIVINRKVDNNGTVKYQQKMVPLLSFVLPGIVVERLYLEEDGLRKLAKMKLPDDITFEKALLLCDEYKFFRRDVVKIGLFDYEELGKDTTGEENTTLRYKEVDLHPMSFFMNFSTTRSKNIYAKHSDFVIKILNMLVSHLKSVKKVSVPFWGVINKGAVFLPTNSDVTREVVMQMANMFADDFNFVAEQIKKMSPEELRKTMGQILVKLYNYINDDEISKLIFQYSLGSIFAYYLFYQKKISLVPSLVIIGPKSTGKSNRTSLFSEEMWLGNTIGGKATIQALQNTKSSTYRFDAYQFLVAPLHFDELMSFPDELIGIIKDQSTSFGKSASIRGRGNISKGATFTPYIRTYMLSVNHFDLKEDAFADRLIFIDLNDDYYRAIVSQINGSDKYRLRIELADKIFYLGVYLLLNANVFLPLLDSISAAKERKESKKVLIDAGGVIAKHLFGMFGINYESVEYVDREINSAITLGDKLWESIFNEVSDVLRHQKNLTSWAIVVQTRLSLSQLKTADSEVQLSYQEIVSLLLSKMFYLGYSQNANALYLLISNQTLKMFGTKHGISNLRSLYEELKNTPFVRKYQNNAVIYERLYPYVLLNNEELGRGERAWFVGIRIDLIYPHISPVVESLEPQIQK